MDTPEKTQINPSSSLSKFEESPVFSYINSLSPIQPVKSLHATQALHSLSFSSLPSIFSSPHVSSSHKESRFLKRHNSLDAARSDLSAENGKISSGGIDGFVAQLYESSGELQENFDAGVSGGEDFKFGVELPRQLNDECGSPIGNASPCRTTTVVSRLEVGGVSLSIVPSVKDGFEKGLPEVEAHLQGIGLIEQKKETTECDWESLVSDADLLVFNSTVNAEAFKGMIQKSLDADGSLCVARDDILKLQDIEFMDLEDPSTQPGEAIEPEEIGQTHQHLAACYNSQTCGDQNVAGTSATVTCKAVANMRRGMRRRCLDFEIVKTRRNNSDMKCSTSIEPGDKTASEDKQLVPVKPANDSAKCLLPGIGLHLNSLAKTLRENREESPFSKNLSCSSAPFHSPTAAGQDLEEQLAIIATEQAADHSIDDVLIVEDVPQASSYLGNEEFSQSSPRKKRNKLDTEDGSCKRCNCKKSKCLKLYCECFASGVYCIEPCSCQDCFNKPIHEDTVLATRKQIETRNPLAFAPKVIRSSESVSETADEFSKTPASARHKRGCNCKKSNCLKKYCECYQGGVGCSVNCRCEGCKNAFGRKDGTGPLETETVPEDEAEACEKNENDKAPQKTDIENNEEQSSAIPSTPLGLPRPLIQLPYSSKSKPPTPRSFLSISLSSAMYTGKHSILPTQPKFIKPLRSLSNDNMPEILQSKCSPSNGVKTSPNGKRVSPPQINIRVSSPARISSSRKLILQSIPSFPSLTHQQ